MNWPPLMRVEEQTAATNCRKIFLELRQGALGSSSNSSQRVSALPQENCGDGKFGKLLGGLSTTWRTSNADFRHTTWNHKSWNGLGWKRT